MVEAATAEKLGKVYLELQQYDKAEGYLLHSLDLIRESASVVCELALLPQIGQLCLRKFFPLLLRQLLLFQMVPPLPHTKQLTGKMSDCYKSREIGQVWWA